HVGGPLLRVGQQPEQPTGGVRGGVPLRGRRRRWTGHGCRLRRLLGEGGGSHSEPEPEPECQCHHGQRERTTHGPTSGLKRTSQYSGWLEPREAASGTATSVWAWAVSQRAANADPARIGSWATSRGSRPGSICRTVSVPPAPLASTRTLPSARQTGAWPLASGTGRGNGRAASAVKSAVAGCDPKSQPVAAGRSWAGAAYSRCPPSGDQASGGNGSVAGSSRPRSAR